MRKRVWFAAGVVIAAAGIWFSKQRPPPVDELTVNLEPPFNFSECVGQGDCRTFEPYARELMLPEPDRPTPPPDYVKRDADNGDPEQATQYGKWLLEMTNPLAAEPYLEIGAKGGNLAAHAALADLKMKRSAGNDRIEAWAHLRAVEREDGTVDPDLFNSIDALLDDDERAAAEDLAWQFRDVMRRSRNNLERLKD